MLCLQIALKKILNSNIGIQQQNITSEDSYEEDLYERLPQDNLIFFFHKCFNWVKNMLKNIPKISFLALLFLEIAMKNTFNLDFGRQLQDIFILFFHLSVIYSQLDHFLFEILQACFI